MCWNANVSKNTFIFSTTPLVICLYLKLISFQDYICYQSFITIQLIEYFLWTFLNNKKWNRIFSIIGYILIVTIPVIFMLNNINKYTKYILGLYVLYIFMIQFMFPPTFHTSIAPNKHLEWEWIKLPIPIFLLWHFFMNIAAFISFYLNSYKNVNIPLLLFTTFIYLITLYSYYSSNTVGSMWCWIANIFSFYFYFLIIKKINNEHLPI